MTEDRIHTHSALVNHSETIPTAASESTIGKRGPSVGRHTPGPWQLRYSTMILDDYTFTSFDSVVGPDGKKICIQGVAVAMGGSPDDETFANARLIAAAPDMLAALRGLIDRYCDLVNCGDCGNWDPETEEPVQAASAAIAKATGA